MKRTVLYHLHIFKNAGSTIDWILKRNFEKCWADLHGPHPESTLSAEEIEQFLITHDQVVAFSSHHARFPLPKQDHVSLFPIIFLRHPVDRALSVYYFMRKQRGEFQRLGIPEDASLQDYIRLRSRTGTEIGNWQTFFLSHERNLKEQERTVTGSDLELARERIVSSAVIGVVDEFDDSLVVAEHSLKPYMNIDISYIPQNVTTGRDATLSDRLFSARTQLGDDLWGDFMKHNSFDFKLYEFAKEELNRRRSQIPGFESRISALRERCLQRTARNTV